MTDEAQQQRILDLEKQVSELQKRVKEHEFCIAPVSAETFTKYHLCDYDTDKQERFWEFFNYYQEQLWEFWWCNCAKNNSGNFDDAIVQCIDVIKHRTDMTMTKWMQIITKWVGFLCLTDKINMKSFLLII